MVFQCFNFRGNVLHTMKDIYINISKIAEVKGLKSTRSLRMAINKGKYKARTIPVNGGYSYEILYSSLEPEIQEKLEDDEIRSTALVPIDNQKPTFISESARMTSLARADIVTALENIKNKDMIDIMKWASNHHEKLNGTGYPLGLTGDQLSMEERLMTCCDIYQALTEERAYKKGFPHEEAIRIMREMGMKGEIDLQIVQTMDGVFSTQNLDKSIPTSILT